MKQSNKKTKGIFIKTGIKCSKCGKEKIIKLSILQQKVFCPNCEKSID